VRLIAVLGTGSIGMRHARALRDLDSVEVVLVPVREPRRRELEEQGWRVSESVGKIDNLSGVIVATDTGRHVADLGAAVEAGARCVLVEKPVAPSIEIAKGAQIRGSRAFVGYCFRFDQGLAAFEDALSDAGDLHRVDIRAGSYLPNWRPGRDYRSGYASRPSEGGVLLDLSHEIDYALHLFGVPRVVTASMSNSGRLGIESEDQADLRWISARGAAVNIELDYLTRPTVRTAVAYGSKATVTWDLANRTITQAGAERVNRTELGGKKDDMYERQALAFLGACEGGEGAGLVTWDEGMAVVATCDAARRSARSHRPEEVMA
jgi:predicted dehydrogenase